MYTLRLCDFPHGPHEMRCRNDGHICYSFWAATGNTNETERNKGNEKKVKSKPPKIQREPSAELLPAKSTKKRFAWEEVTDSDDDDPKEYGAV